MTFTIEPADLEIGIVGTGAMGRGIAQVTALAGYRVHLFDANREAVGAALASIGDTLAMLANKGRLSTAAADAARARLVPVAALEALAGCGLVVEAIVEDLAVKRELVARLEAVLASDAVIVSNTSSLSITAIAARAVHPERILGWHFFNPVPLMKVVEVVDALCSEHALGDALMELSRRIGHTPVRAKDTPGFIVNHAGRGFGTEALRIVGEGVATFADVDRVMREAAGFRLGPFELFDLTALDVSHPVMESIYHQFYEEPRFRPSVITAQRLAGGWFGRKSGRGFYRYDGSASEEVAAGAGDALPTSVWISPALPAAQEVVRSMIGSAVPVVSDPRHAAVCVVTPLGLDATSAALAEGLDARLTVALDIVTPAPLRRTLMKTPVTRPEVVGAAHALFASGGVPVTVIRDSAGFIAQRILAMIVNIACDIAQQRIASPHDIDLAVRLGLNYPSGPLALGDALGPARVLSILRNLQAFYGDPRYRPSPWLTRRAGLGLSLSTEES